MYKTILHPNEVSILNLTLRAAVTNDFDSIHDIWIEELNKLTEDRQVKGAFSKKFKENFQNRNDTYNFWVAETTDKCIVGWQCVLNVFNNPFRANLYGESSTYISGNYRNMGLGKKLLSYATMRSKENGLAYLIGVVSKNNIVAKKLLDDLAWQQVLDLPNNSNNLNKSKVLFYKSLF